MTQARQSAIQLSAVILLALSSLVVLPPAQAELPSPAMLANLKAGKVEAVGTASIQISGVEYPVKSNAEILDHKGNEITLERVLLFSEARFHVSKNGDIDMMEFEWVFVGPDAALNDRSGKRIGKYYGPPATWEAMDGSKVTGAQLAVSPAGAGSIPMQLVKANPAMGNGAMQGVTFIQRVATQGGVAPSAACGASSMGQKQVVKYQADYVFWRAL